MSSPFFLAAKEQALPKEMIRFKRIDLIEDQDSATQDLFVTLCNRTQALSPSDREALGDIVISEFLADNNQRFVAEVEASEL